MCALRSVKTNLNSGGAVSKLYIANANRNDSGNYSCSLGETAQTTIAVHVLNGMYGLYVIYYFGCNNSSSSPRSLPQILGENPAAAQQSGTANSSNHFVHCVITLSLLICLCQQR